MGIILKKVKTRKAHRCYICRHYFPKGSIMYTSTDNFDNYATIYSCEVCEEKKAKITENNNLII